MSERPPSPEETSAEEPPRYGRGSAGELERHRVAREASAETARSATKTLLELLDDADTTDPDIATPLAKLRERLSHYDLTAEERTKTRQRFDALPQFDPKDIGRPDLFKHGTPESPEQK